MADNGKRLALSTLRHPISWLFAVSPCVRYPLTMKKRAVLFIFLSVLAGLNLGTVRKKDNPILNAQTDPILYEQKKEEEKDGVKGPLLYHVKHDPLETFFIEPPFSSGQEETGGQLSAQPAAGPGEAADWWEEQPTGEEAPSVVPRALYERARFSRSWRTLLRGGSPQA